MLLPIALPIPIKIVPKLCIRMSMFHIWASFGSLESCVLAGIINWNISLEIQWQFRRTAKSRIQGFTVKTIQGSKIRTPHRSENLFKVLI